MKTWWLRRAFRRQGREAEQLIDRARMKALRHPESLAAELAVAYGEGLALLAVAAEAGDVETTAYLTAKLDVLDDIIHEVAARETHDSNA